jgi:hypothetical protein
MAKQELGNEIEKLERQIEVRKKLVLSYLNFVKKIMSEIGERTLYEESSNHTKTKWELLDFHGFRFFGAFGLTCFGGNEIIIEFNREQRGWLSVLSVYWQDKNDLDVKVFDTNNDWQKLLKQIISQRERLIAEFNNAKKQQVTENKLVKENSQRLAELQKQAERLNLS